MKLYRPEEIVNKIDNKLAEQLNLMAPRDLISYRRAISPPKISFEPPQPEEDDKSTEYLDTAELMRTYDEAIKSAVNRDIEAARARKQVDSSKP